MNDFYMNKKWMDLLNSAFQFIYLNALWIVFSLPLVTFWPATAAMFAIIRKWIRKEEAEIFTEFKKQFKENFKPSFYTGAAWTALAFVFLVNFYLVNTLPLHSQFIGLLLFGMASVVFLFITASLLPIIVHFQTSFIGIWKNAFILAIQSPLLSIAKSFVLLLSAFIILKVPIALFGMGSVAAYYLVSITLIQLRKWEE